MKDFLDCFRLRADSQLPLIIGQTVQSAGIKVNLCHGISVSTILLEFSSPRSLAEDRGKMR